MPNGPCLLHRRPTPSSNIMAAKADLSQKLARSSPFASHKTCLDLAPSLELITIYRLVLLDTTIIMLLSYALLWMTTSLSPSFPCLLLCRSRVWFVINQLVACPIRRFSATSYPCSVWGGSHTTTSPVPDTSRIWTTSSNKWVEKC